MRRATRGLGHLARNACFLAALALSLTAGSAAGSPAAGMWHPNATILHWDGTKWSSARGAHRHAALVGTGTVAGSIWAVGWAPAGSSRRPVAEHRKGSSWRGTAVPSGRSGFGELEGVAGTSPRDVWAVGWISAGKLGTPHTSPLIEHWNGERWAIVPNPLSRSSGYLAGVAALSPTNVWAVGSPSVILHWNGKRWRRVGFPIPAGPGPYPSGGGRAHVRLFSLTALSAHDIWAAGNERFLAYRGHVRDQTFILHWDGTQWTLVASPNHAPVQHGSTLSGVAGAGANEVWAVGSWGTGHGRQALIERWNGKSWRIAATPVASSGALAGAVTLSAADAWAVGDSLALHWNGSSWTRVLLPSTESGVLLSQIAAVSPTDLWAVGFENVY